MAIDVSGIQNNNKFDPVREALLELETQIADTGSAIGNGTITISTSGNLTGSGSFTLNQFGNSTITIGIDDASYLTSSDISDFLTQTDTDLLYLPLAGGTLTGDLNGTNLILSGYLRGPSTLVIDPAAHGNETGLVQILGDLRVDGATTIINSTTINVSDKNITIAKDAATAGDANGAGITIAGANATLTYLSVSDDFTFNKSINSINGTFSGNVTGANLAISDWNDAYSWGDHDGLYLPIGGGTLTGDLTLDDKLTITGTTNNFVIDEEADGTWHLYDTFQDNGIVLYSGSGGMDFQYNGVTEMTIDGSGVSFTGTINLDAADLNIGSADIIFGTTAGGATRGLIWDVSGSGFLSKLIGGGADGGKVTLFANMDDAITTGNIFEIKDGSTGSLFLGLSHAGILTAGGGTSTQWNTAYTYSQVGHLPLAGGTLTGALTINADDGVKATYNINGGDTWLRGWGLESNRSAVYYRPTTDSTQTLLIGYSEGSLIWETVSVDAVNFDFNGNAVIHAGNIGSQSVAYAANAGLLDSIDSTSFLRSDVNDYASGKVFFTHHTNTDPLAAVEINGGTTHTGLYINPSASSQAHVRFGTNGTLKWQFRVPFQDSADADLKIFSFVSNDDMFNFKHTGVLNFKKSSGTIISTGGGSDAFGYTTSYGHYIQGTGSRYIYGDGYYYDGAVHRTLIHSGNIAAQSVASAGNADTLDSLDSSQFLRSDTNSTKTGWLAVYSTIGASDNVRSGLAHYDNTAMAAGVGGQIVLGYFYTSASDPTEGAIIKMYKENGTSGDYSSGLKFQVRNTGADLSTKMTLDPSGRLGIGTTTPNAALEVNGNIYTTSNTNFLLFGTNPAANPYIQSGSDNSLYIGTVDLARITLKADGKVSVGTTSTYGNFTAQQTTGEAGITINSSIAEPPTIYLRDAGGAGYSRVLANNNLLIEATRLGIGTDTPGEKLHIKNNFTVLKIESTAAGNNANVHFQTTDRKWGIGPNMALSTSVFEIYDYTANQNRLVIDTSGYVGIGTTSPGHKLDVVGNVLVRNSLGNALFYSAAEADNSGTFYMYNNGTLKNAIATNGNSYFTGGNVGIGTTNPISGLGTPLTLENSVNGYVGISLRGTGSYENTWQLYASGDGGSTKFFGVYDRTNSAYRFVATNSGNVGIGTTSPATKLHVNYTSGTGLTLSNTEANLYAEMRLQSLNGSAYIFKSSSGYSAYGGTNALNIFNEGQIAFHSNTVSNIMHLASAGNVGIGTTTNSTVGGFTDTTVLIKQKANGGAGGGLHIEQSGVDNVAFFGFNGSAFIIGTSYRIGGAYMPIELTTQGSPRIHIANNGFVGIGTTSPREKLQITGNTVIGNHGLNCYKTNLYLTYSATTDETWFRIYLPQDYASDNNGGTVKVKVLWAGNHATFGAYQEYQVSYKTFYPASPYLKFSNVLCMNKTSDFGGATYYSPTSTPDVLFYDNSDGYLYVKVKGTHNPQNTPRYVEAEIFGRTTAQPTIATTTAPASPSLIVKTIEILPQEGNLYVSNRIGIGTVSPSEKLHVNGGDILSTNTNPLIRLSPDSGTSAFIQKLSAANGDYLRIYDGTEYAATFKNGQIGIGTTSPSYKLHVKGSGNYDGVIAVDNGTTTGGGILLIRQNGVNSGFLGVLGSALGTSGRDLTYYSDSGLGHYFYVNDGTMAMRIASDGKVGIGTTNPGTKLSVVGTIRSTEQVDASPSVGAFRFYDGGTFYGGLGIGGWCGVGTTADMTMYLAATNKFHISKSSVAFATFNSENSSFQVTSTIGSGDNVRYGISHYDDTPMAAGVGGQIVLGYKYTSVGDLTEGAIIKMYKENGTSGQYGSGLKFQVRNHGPGLSTKLTLDPSGNLTAAGDVYAYSDARVKENVETINNALDKVIAMRGVSYNKKDTEDKTKKVGVIAQEMQKVLPEVVSEQEDGMLSVSYGNIVGVLIEAIKEQQKQIDELKAIINGGTK